MFETVLVANRGEIAVRIIRTLRGLHIRSVAVYSDGDRASRHVQEADLAIRLGPTPARESYLSIERILQAAELSGAEAVHPGYGFLSENADFARSCEAMGLVFVGPSPRAIELMGDKIRAKLTVASAGVPVVPGRAERGMSNDDLVIAASEIGFPVLVKPSAGGGGKGMHLVEHPDDLVEALNGARREATLSFGDDTLLLERYVKRPRHIEVQILADAFGTAVHLGERECSLQRRHQKVVEEAPSPLINHATRDRLGDAAVAAAVSVEYTGVGTVEFIVSADRPDEFFFMEMNTRLQVEHPVTEMVTGLDLVEQQLRVSAGEHLGFAPSALEMTGHAIEARIYSESPSRGFLPTTGRISVLQEPTGEGIRVDSSLLDGLEINTSYDPMLAKVIAWGPDRAIALARLGRALSQTIILGVETNLGFLQKLIALPDVVNGDIDTELIERNQDLLATTTTPIEAYAAYALTRFAEITPHGPIIDPWDVPSGLRVGGRAEPILLKLLGNDEDPLEVRVAGTPTGAVLSFDNGEELESSIRAIGDHSVVTVDSVSHLTWTATGRPGMWVFIDGLAWLIQEETLSRRDQSTNDSDGEIRSPMPGRVVSLRVTNGDYVSASQPLLVVEAMKMENILVAPDDGLVSILVREDDSVVVDEVVARIYKNIEKPKDEKSVETPSDVREKE